MFRNVLNHNTGARSRPAIIHSNIEESQCNAEIESQQSFSSSTPCADYEGHNLLYEIQYGGEFSSDESDHDYIDEDTTNDNTSNEDDDPEQDEQLLVSCRCNKGNCKNCICSKNSPSCTLQCSCNPAICVRRDGNPEDFCKKWLQNAQENAFAN